MAPPYVAGALSGLVIVGSVWLTGKYAGASTSFVRGAGYPDYVSRGTRNQKRGSQGGGKSLLLKKRP